MVSRATSLLFFKRIVNNTTHTSHLGNLKKTPILKHNSNSLIFEADWLALQILLMRPNGDFFNSPSRVSPLKDSGHFFPQSAVGLSHRETMLPEEADGLAEGKPEMGSSYEQLASAKERRLDFSTKLTSTINGPHEGQPSSPMINEIDPKPEVNHNENMNISKKLEILIDKVSEFSPTAEYSKNMASDDLQWTEEERLEIPDDFKSEISGYINSDQTTTLRLQRGVSGYHGCLWYIVNNRLLVWFFNKNLTVDHTFFDPIQDVGMLLSQRIHLFATSTRHHWYTSVRSGGHSARGNVLQDDNSGQR